jgi:histone acetyltransferase 1
MERKIKKEESKIKAFTSEANNVLKFHLIDNDRCTSSEGLSTFRPLYTHQVFSSMEKIFGYKNLKVDIYLSCATFRSFLKVRYSKKLPK